MPSILSEFAESDMLENEHFRTSTRNSRVKRSHVHR